MKPLPTPPRKTGRPLSFDRSAALRQAMLVFWRHGYETSSIADLTGAMGITPPSLYAAFGDKKQLFLEAARLYAGDPAAFAATIDRAPSAFDAASEMLDAVATAFTGDDTPRGCLLASATASGSSAAEDVQRAVADIRRGIAANLAARIARDIEDGALPANTDAAALAGMVVALIQGMSVLARDGASRDTLQAVAKAAMKAWPSSPS
jgi:AcrR family transcriptional regulator